MFLIDLVSSNPPNANSVLKACPASFVPMVPVELAKGPQEAFVVWMHILWLLGTLSIGM